MKKLLTILGMITCMVGLTACGQEANKTLTEQEASLLESGVAMVESINQIVQQGAEEQYADNEPVYLGIQSWMDAIDDIGDYEGTDGGDVTVDGEEITIQVNVLGSDHDAEVEIILEGDMTTYVNITSITTNVSYTMGELMENAAMNTVIGMGTVFVVLILIIFIISGFSLISKFEDKGSKKEEKKAEAAADPVVTQIAAKEELADDTELVAVIAAAVAAYEGAGSTDGFVVRSIRKSNKSKWQNA